MKLVRLQKYIADCGVTSRRKAEGLIEQGRVLVNGEKVVRLGTKVNIDSDAVEVDGTPISASDGERIYILLHKPRGYLTTVSDPEGRKTVMDLVGDMGERVYPVGRLDYLSEGLLMLTNDGEMAQKIAHPTGGIVKVYEVKVFGILSAEHLEKLREGALIGGTRVRPLSVRVIKRLAAKTWLEFRIGEGKNREIRRICEVVGLTVDKLRRVSIGGLSIRGISPGKYTFLRKRQVEKALARGEGEWSEKKSLRLKKSPGRRENRADDKKFRRFRRESYFQTLKNQ